jgi:hypothetical protein
VLLTTLLFPFVDWRGCWSFRYGRSGFVVFAFLFAWLVAFLALGTTWPVVLLVVTLAVVAPVVGTRFGLVEQNAGPESAAVVALCQIQSSLHAYYIEHQERAYPDSTAGRGTAAHGRKVLSVSISSETVRRRKDS